jgi:hypothetical protein
MVMASKILKKREGAEVKPRKSFEADQATFAR